jgi:small-conductance mechanosensitive channel
VRVGDRIKIEDMEGRVESISVRDTVIITNENMAVIVPNSILTKNKFTNWSYGKQNVRIGVPIAVAYINDLKLVTEALLEAARSVPEVLKNPAPKVNFREWGDTSYKLEVQVWINEPHKHPQIRSSISYQIDNMFTKYGIEIVPPTPALASTISAVPSRIDNRFAERKH